MNYLKKVADFHETFNAPILDKPKIPSKDRCELRVELIAEELKELKDAIKNNDLNEVADALCDLQYVLSGTILEFGLGEKFNELFKEVQRSNMSKASETMEDALETLEHYKNKDGTKGYIKEIGEKWVCYRNSDNKVLKSIKYSPVDFSKILE